MFQCYYLKSSHPHLFNRHVLSTYYKQSSLGMRGGLVSGHLLLFPEDTQVLYIKWVHPQIWKAKCIHIRACVMLVLVHVKLLHSCLNLCNTMDGSPQGSSVHGILQARTLEWVAISFSRGSSKPRDQTGVSYYLLHWQVGSLPVGPPGKPEKNNKHNWKGNEGGLPQPPETRDCCYGCYQNTGENGKLPVLSTGLTDWTRITHTHTHTHTHRLQWYKRSSRHIQ